MEPNADCYLPGVLRCGAGDPSLERPDGERIPLADPAELLTPEMDGERCTVGADVEVAAVADDADAPPGVRTDGVHVTLVGDRRVRYTGFTDRNSATRIDLTFDAGVWPVAAGSNSGRTGPPTRRPGPVRIDAERLTVGDVLVGERDPFDEPLTDLRVEWDGSGRTRLTVPGVPIWSSNGWMDVPPARMLARLGRLTLAALETDSVEAVSSSTHLKLVVTGEGDTLRLDCPIVGEKVGVVPAGGVQFDRRALARSWLRDARLFTATRDAEEVEQIVTEFEAEHDLVPADGRPVLTDPPGTAALIDRLRDGEPDRDAVAALAQRGAGTAVLADLLRAREGTAADQWRLVTALESIGGPAATEKLMAAVADDPPRWIQRRAESAIRAQPPAVAASVLLDRSVDGVTEAVAAELLELLADHPDDFVRSLAVETLGNASLEGLPDRFADRLVDALVTESSGLVRTEIATAIGALDSTFADEMQVRGVARQSERAQRQAMVDLARAEPPVDPADVVTGLDGTDESLQRLAASAAAECDEPPFDALTAALENDSNTVSKAAAESLASLAGTDTVGMPRAAPLIEAASSRQTPQNTAVDAILELARAYDGGEFYGLSPTTALCRLDAADTGYMTSLNDKMAETITEVVAGAGPDVVLDLPADTRAYVAYTLGREGDERAGPALRALVGDSDDLVSWAVVRAFHSLPALAPLDEFDLDLRRHNRFLILYVKVAKQAARDDDRARFDDALDGLLSLTADDAWHVRTKAVVVLRYFQNVPAVADRIETLAESDPSRTVRRTAVYVRAKDDRGAARELFERLRDEDEAPLVREAARKVVDDEVGVDFDDATLDRVLDGLPDDVDPEDARAVLADESPDRALATVREGMVEAGAAAATDDDRDVVVREAALDLLARVRQLQPRLDIDSVVEPLEAVAGSDEVEDRLRETARTNLAFLTNRKSYDALDRAGGERPVTETW